MAGAFDPLRAPVVHKFGGTSLDGAERFRAVAEIIRNRPEPHRVIVVSAMKGVTNTLVRVVEQAGLRDSSYRASLARIAARQHRLIRELRDLGAIPPKTVVELESALDRDLEEAADVLRAAWVLHHSPTGAGEMVSGLGEVWSARLLSALLAAKDGESEWLDARAVLIAELKDGRVRLDWDASRERLRQWRARQGSPRDIVATGFIAATPTGVPTTLGRNGSDYSASIFASLFEAREIHIWTDVDGVRSADPRIIPEAVHLESMSYHEALELAHFGSRVIHPATMGPAVEAGIPIYIRNSLQPEGRFTRIDGEGGAEQLVKGLSLVDHVALINVEGTGLSASPAISHRLFGAIKDAGINALLVSQGSSQHSICFAVPLAEASQAAAALDAAFFAERHQGLIQTIDVDRDCAMLALVGDGMSGHPGVAAQFFSALGRAGVNIKAIAQGSSERNISVVVDAAQAAKALRAAHSGLYLSRQTLSIGIIGAGVVGAELINQLHRRASQLRAAKGVDLRVRAIATRSRMLLHDRRLPLEVWRGTLAEAEPFDLDAFLDHLQTDDLPHTVIVDCTADEGLARRYGEWLRRGIHVVTPNKKANTLDIDYYRQLRQAGSGAPAHYLYEATVGAGLPIIHTLRDLIETGDEVVRIEGVLSGTLSYLFNSFDGTRPFSGLVAEARHNGFTEPDPREDLSGTDVVRKLVILAREMGLELETDDIALNGLVPEALKDGSVEDFLSGLGAHDADMARLAKEARARGEVLRFIGSVEPGGGSRAELRAVPLSNPFAALSGTDNLVRFETRRYLKNPLVVQGPGAGPEVTAGGIFADLLRLAAYLGGGG